MLKLERQEQILNILQTKRYSTVNELSKLLYTSSSSIRRTLIDMENLNLVKRSYGGVEICENNTFVIPHNLRINKDAEQKKIIARKAAALVSDGDVIFLDHSSTCTHLAFEIAQRKSLTVITNNIDIIMYLKDFSVDIICSGGKICTHDVDALTGKYAERVFENTHADFAFFSSHAISQNGTIYDCVYETANVRAKMLENARRKVYLCTENKINTFSAYKQCTLADIDYLICNSEKANVFKDKFAGLTVL